MVILCLILDTIKSSRSKTGNSEEDESIEDNLQGINMSERKLRTRNIKCRTEEMTGKEKPCLGILVDAIPPV
jgi:hypothetical protein